MSLLLKWWRDSKLFNALYFRLYVCIRFNVWDFEDIFLLVFPSSSKNINSTMKIESMESHYINSTALLYWQKYNEETMLRFYVSLSYSISWISIFSDKLVFSAKYIKTTVKGSIGYNLSFVIQSLSLWPSMFQYNSMIRQATLTNGVSYALR